ncbi:MAG: hypothetical protein IJK94_04100 [Bacteroidaceae bacterium]|nr:hypothetical protein [Bacteroidaceae bacterium]
MSISEQELKTFIKEDNQMQNEGIGYINETTVDFQGITTEDIVKKIYNCVPMEEVSVTIRGIGSFTYLCNGSDVFIQFFTLSCVKYSSKRSCFLRFYVYLCHVIDDFASLELQHEGK